MRLYFLHFLFSSLVLVGGLSCNHTPPCKDIQGVWTDREGLQIVFNSDGKGLWLNKFGQMIDTVSFIFHLDCKQKPAALDLNGFSSGPFVGKTLFGIVEWSADTLCRFCFETGQDAGQRPKRFDPEQTIKLYR